MEAYRLQQPQRRATPPPVNRPAPTTDYAESDSDDEEAFVAAAFARAEAIRADYIQDELPQSGVQRERAPPPTERPSAQRQQSTVLSVADIDNKTCWICYASEGDSEQGADPADASKGDWVHACKCALFAHQNCLLHWINETQSTRPRGTLSKSAVVCPQCRSPYHIQQRKSPLLDFLDQLDRVLDHGAIRLSIAFVGSGLVVASGVYGVAATRAFLGTKQANVLLSQTWRWSWFGNFPMIAPILILARTNMVDALLPLLPLSLLSTTNRTLPAFDPVTRIPSPTTTVILLPWLRLLYDRLYRIFARRLVRRVRTQPSLYAQMPEAAPIQVAFPPAAPQAEEAGAAAAPDNLANAAVTLSVNVLARIFAGALLLPFISAAAGDVLLEVARASGSPALRQLLGLADRKAWDLALSTSRGHFFLQGLGLATATSAKTAARGTTWLKWASLGFGNFTSAGGGNLSGQEDALRDPVWWRNALGGCLFILAKDALLLIRRVLDIKRKQSRKIRQTAINKGLDLELKKKSSTESQ